MSPRLLWLLTTSGDGGFVHDGDMAHERLGRSGGWGGNPRVRWYLGPVGTGQWRWRPGRGAC